ncbi:hypothetical protein THAOC_30494, partial [Thalassiosira oceanica]
MCDSIPGDRVRAYPFGAGEATIEVVESAIPATVGPPRANGTWTSGGVPSMSGEGGMHCRWIRARREFRQDYEQRGVVSYVAKKIPGSPRLKVIALCPVLLEYELFRRSSPASTARDEQRRAPVAEGQMSAAAGPKGDMGGTTALHRPA